MRRAVSADADALWAILEPMIREGATYPLPRDWERESALGYWLSANHTVHVAEVDGRVVGTYYMRPNTMGGGSHIANCGYVVAPDARGMGVAGRMCAHSLEIARQAGYTGMQYNFVIATNAGAVHLWTRMGFETVGRLPGVFAHPEHGFVDALVMFRAL